MEILKKSKILYQDNSRFKKCRGVLPTAPRSSME